MYSSFLYLRSLVPAYPLPANSLSEYPRILNPRSLDSIKYFIKFMKFLRFKGNEKYQKSLGMSWKVSKSIRSRLNSRSCT